MTNPPQAEAHLKRYLQKLRQAKFLTVESRPNTINMIRFNRRVNLIRGRAKQSQSVDESSAKQNKLVDTPMTKVTVTTAVRQKKIKKADSIHSTPQNNQKTVKVKRSQATEQ